MNKLDILGQSQVAELRARLIGQGMTIPEAEEAAVPVQGEIEVGPGETKFFHPFTTHACLFGFNWIFERSDPDNEPVSGEVVTQLITGHTGYLPIVGETIQTHTFLEGRPIGGASTGQVINYGYTCPIMLRWSGSATVNSCPSQTGNPCKGSGS